MYNLWIVAIVVGILLVATIVLHFVAKKKYWSDVEDGCFVMMLLLSVAFAASITVGIALLIEANQTVMTLTLERDLLVNLLEGQEGFDKIAITQRIVEYNHELAQIIANVKSFGDWSPYTFTDYELLTFIEI